MPKPKETKNLDGEIMHYSVGAIIKQGEKYLLIDRVNIPLGFAALAGHIDLEEAPEEALKREVEEESSLIVEGCNIIAQGEVPDVTCVHGISRHYWYVFDCVVSGEIKKESSEEKSIGWYTPDEMKKLTFEPSWNYWLKKLKVI